MKIIGPVVIALVVSGCTLPSEGTRGDRFDDVTPKPVNKAHTGFWTGPKGQNLLTLRIDGDGRGVSCTTRDGKDTLTKLRISDGRLYFQDGTRMALTYADGYIDGQSLGVESQSVRFTKDVGLTQASPYCKEQLQKSYL